jgi:hypothetical protein
MCEIACFRHAHLVNANRILYCTHKGKDEMYPSHHFLVVSTTVPLMLSANRLSKAVVKFELLSPECHVTVRVVRRLGWILCQ